MGLVEIDEQAAPPEPEIDDLDDDELLALLGDDASSDAPPGEPAVDETAPAPPPPPLPPSAPPAAAGAEAAEGLSSEVEEGRPFEAIYAAAQVPESPFSAEKLLRVLDGLAAMDPVTRKTAILAMDAADDVWTIDDPLLDAERKSRALQSAQVDLARTLEAAEQRAAAEIQAQDEAQAEAVELIKQQIAELEKTMAEVVGEATTQREAARNGLLSTRTAVARETARFAAEMERLGRLKHTFG